VAIWFSLLTPKEKRAAFYNAIGRFADLIALRDKWRHSGLWQGGSTLDQLLAAASSSAFTASCQNGDMSRKVLMTGGTFSIIKSISSSVL